MEILIAITSILGITGAFLVINRIGNIKVCPICAGVSGTWLWILAGMYLGVLDISRWQLVAAIVMGGTIVGIAYQAERYLSPRYSSLLWKTLFIPIGFAAVYGLILFWWFVFIAATIGLVVLALIFMEKPQHSAGQLNKMARSEQSRGVYPEQSRRVAELENKMKNCC